MYFSGMPRGVDARPPAQPEEDAASVLSENGGTDAGRSESLPLVSEKVRGKRAAADELVQKKRKTVATGHLKLGGISLGGNQTTQTWRAAVIEWSDDDKDPVAPPSSMQAPPRSTRVEEQSRGSKEFPEQQARGFPE